MSGHKIFPHGEFRELAPGVWQLRGSLPIPLSRNMTVVRLPDGSLLIYSAIALDDTGMKALAALGTPSVMVVPHPLHVMDAPFFAERFPQMRIAAPADARAKLPASCTVHGTPEELLRGTGIGVHTARGLKFSEVVLDVPLPDGKRALVFTDLVTNGKQKGFVMSLLGAPGGKGVARIVKFRQVARKSDARAFLEELATTPNLQLALVAHGSPVTEDVPAFLRNAAAQL